MIALKVGFDHDHGDNDDDDDDDSDDSDNNDDNDSKHDDDTPESYCAQCNNKKSEILAQDLKNSLKNSEKLSKFEEKILKIRKNTQTIRKYS